MTKQELLAVLDMSELEQWRWVDSNTDRQHYDDDGDRVNTESLADLAFRLRNEADPIALANSIALVYVGARLGATRPTAEALLGWLIAGAKPIHWIISALITKQA